MHAHSLKKLSVLLLELGQRGFHVHLPALFDPTIGATRGVGPVVGRRAAARSARLLGLQFALIVMVFIAIQAAITDATSA